MSVIRSKCYCVLLEDRQRFSSPFLKQFWYVRESFKEPKKTLLELAMYFLNLLGIFKSLFVLQKTLLELANHFPNLLALSSFQILICLDGWSF